MRSDVRRIVVVTMMAALTACGRDMAGPANSRTPRSGPAFAVIPGSGSWSTAAAEPVVLRGSAGAAVGGKFYVTGGSEDVGGLRGIVLRYDPGTDVWDTVASMPDSLKYHVAVATSGDLYVASGTTPTQYCNAHLWRYRPGTNTWSVRAPAPRCHNFTAAASLGGYIYLIGGSDASDAGLTAVDRYDPATNSWTTVAPMPVTLNSHEAQVVNGRIYVVGGFNLTSLVSNDLVYEYDPGTNNWATKASYTGVYAGDANHATSGAIDGIVYLMYGASTGAETIAYDPAHDTWTAVASHPNVGWWFRASAVLDGRLHVVGGQDATSGAHDVFAPAFAGNHRPVVASLPAQTLLEGESYDVAGSFTDPDEGPWTATVDWGLGGGQQALGLTGMTFALNNPYPDRGEYRVSVRVDDSEGLRGIRHAEVSVRSVRWGINKLFADVDALVVGGLAAPDGERLYHWLRKAFNRYRDGNATAFDNRLLDFNDEVDELVGEAKVTAGAGNALKAFADRLRAASPD